MEGAEQGLERSLGLTPDLNTTQATWAGAAMVWVSKVPQEAGVGSGETSHSSTILLRNSEEWKSQCMMGTRIAPPGLGGRHRVRKPAGRHLREETRGHDKAGRTVLICMYSKLWKTQAAVGGP